MALNEHQKVFIEQRLKGVISKVGNEDSFRYEISEIKREIGDMRNAFGPHNRNSEIFLNRWFALHFHRPQLFCGLQALDTPELSEIPINTTNVTYANIRMHMLHYLDREIKDLAQNLGIGTTDLGWNNTELMEEAWCRDLLLDNSLLDSIESPSNLGPPEYNCSYVNSIKHAIQTNNIHRYIASKTYPIINALLPFVIMVRAFINGQVEGMTYAQLDAILSHDFKLSSARNSPNLGVHHLTAIGQLQGEHLMKKNVQTWNWLLQKEYKKKSVTVDDILTLNEPQVEGLKIGLILNKVNDDNFNFRTLSALDRAIRPLGDSNAPKNIIKAYSLARGITENQATLLFYSDLGFEQAKKILYSLQTELILKKGYRFEDVRGLELFQVHGIAVNSLSLQQVKAEGFDERALNAMISLARRKNKSVATTGAPKTPDSVKIGKKEFDAVLNLTRDQKDGISNFGLSLKQVEADNFGRHTLHALMNLIDPTPEGSGNPDELLDLPLDNEEAERVGYFFRKVAGLTENQIQKEFNLDIAGKGNFEQQEFLSQMVIPDKPQKSLDVQTMKQESKVRRRGKREKTPIRATTI